MRPVRPGSGSKKTAATLTDNNRSEHKYGGVFRWFHRDTLQPCWPQILSPPNRALAYAATASPKRYRNLEQRRRRDTIPVGRNQRSTHLSRSEEHTSELQSPM